MWAKFWAKILGRGLLWAVLVALVVYPVDWAVWRVRVSHGGGMGEVQVGSVIAAQLKGDKEEYYAEGTTLMPCSQTIYPQGGNDPCWWLVRHPDQITRY